MALKSYLVRGALLEQEIFNRLDTYQDANALLEKELNAMRSANAEVERRLSTLENDRKRLEGQYRRELEMRDDEIKGVKQHRHKQSSTIEKLKGEVQGLKGELVESQKRVKYLSEEVVLEKKARELVQEEAHSQRLTSDGLKMELETARSDYQSARGDADIARGCVEYLESDVGKLEAIEAYCPTPEGKVEVALVVKAGFDFLATRLPEAVRPSEDKAYPLSVYESIHILRSLEAQEVVISLEPVAGDDKEEEESGDEEAVVVQPAEEEAVVAPPALN